MTKEEILIELEEKLIITKIADEYFITENYLDLRSKPVVSPSNKISQEKQNEILNGEETSTTWPFNIQNSKGRVRAVNCMDAIKLPVKSSKGYLIRSLSKDAIIALDKIVADNPNINARLFLDTIKQYYKDTEYCKSFKKLILEGDAMDMYNEAVDRELKGFSTELDPLHKLNQTWG